MRLTLNRNFLLPPERSRFTSAPSSGFSPWTFSRRILETGSAPAANGDSTEIPRDVPSLLQVWSPSQQQNLLQHWGDRRLSELTLLSQEQDTKFYFESLLAFGRDCEEDDRLDLAANVYAALKGQSYFPDIQRRAVEQLQAMQGSGPIGARMGFWLRRLSREATHPSMIFSMWLAGPAFRITRLGILSRLLPFSTAGFGARGFAVEAVAWLGGLAAENSVFTFSAYGLREVLGKANPLSLGSDWVAAGLMLGSLRFGGWAGGRLYQGLRGAEALSLGVREKLPLSLFQQGGVFGGILLSQQVEMRFGSRPDAGWADRLVDGLGTLANSHIAGQLSRSAFGEPWQRREQELEFQIQQLRIQARPGLASRLGNYGSLAWEAAQNAATPRVVSEGMNEARRLNNFIVSDDGNDKANTGPTTENNGALPEARPIAKASASEHPPPPGDADLLEVLRESFEVYPHAASIFELVTHAPETGELQWGQILKINHRFTETFGYQPEEVLGQPLPTFLHPQELPRFEKLPSMLLHDGALQLDEVHFQRKDGSFIWCNLTSALKRGNGRALGFAFLEDVSLQRWKRLKNVERHRIAAAQLDMLQLISGGLAHDCCNALVPFLIQLSSTQKSIQNLGQLARKFRPPHADPRTNAAFEAFQHQFRALHTSITGQESQKLSAPPVQPEIHIQAAEIFETLDARFEIVRKQAAWIQSLIQDFRELTGTRKKGPAFDLHSLLETSTLQDILGDETKLEIHLAPNPWLVPGPRNSLARAVLNLVGNARDAMVGRPTASLRVETAKVSLSREDLGRLAAHSPGISADIAADDFMRLRIRDSGSGMDKATHLRIFEPYFSTKPRNYLGHQGIGLAITRKLVEDAGGFLTVESVLGEGTTFDVYLPRVQTVKTIQSPPRPKPAGVQYIPPK